MAGPVIKRVRISSIEKLTDRSRRFILEPLDNWQPIYRAGQYLTLVFNHLDGEKRRSYSIVSLPDTNEPLSIAVKKIDNGEFSRHLVYYAKPGDILVSAGIQGLFTIPPEAAYTDHVFFAAGSGITPCYPLIRSLLADTSRRILLVFSNSSVNDTMFYNELLALQQQYHDRFSIRFLFSDRFNVNESRLSKPLVQKIIDEEVSKYSPVLFYLCGPELYMLMISITLRSMGYHDDHIFRGDFDTRPRSHHPVPPDTDPHRVTIQIGNETTSLDVQYPESILAAAKKQQLVLPYSCEAGRCGACLAHCSSGKIWMGYNEVLTDDEIKSGLILTCQAFPIEKDAVIKINT